MLTIEITEWDQIDALERMILSLSTAIDNMNDQEVITLLQRDMACLIFIREELMGDIGTMNDEKLPN